MGRNEKSKIKDNDKLWVRAVVRYLIQDGQGNSKAIWLVAIQRYNKTPF